MQAVSVIVRRIEPSEWRLVRELRLRALRDAPSAFSSTVEEELERTDDWWVASAERLAWFIAADTSSTPPGAAGIVAVLRATSEDPDVRSLISMWVAPPYRGTGTAGALVDAAAWWAGQDGASVLSLGVAEPNRRAVRFYERVGFVATGDSRPLRRDPTTLAIEMRLPLRTAAEPEGPARLRFAPSPAGDLHVGHVRIAVLTRILTEQQRGTFFVRLENTDRAKEVPGSRAAIISDLRWLGLLGAEPPHDQADLTASHGAALSQLEASGHIYRDGEALRFRIPTSGTMEWDDLVRGHVVVRNEDLDDPVLVRSSGSPTFYLASTVDDIDDRITHLIRAEPLLRATAKQAHIWRALGATPPQAGHVPLVTGPRGSPVKVGSAAASVPALRERGISATAMLVYLAMPEAASSKTPIGSIDEIVGRLDLRRLPRRPTTFDLRALDLLNRRLHRLDG